MKHLVGKTITEKVPFMGDEVEVKKMTVGEILDMQKLIKSAAKSKKEDAQIGLLRDIIRVAVIDAADITDEEFNSFPISELNSLSEKILELSGIGGSEGN
jgi:hypothetical protein